MYIQQAQKIGCPYCGETIELLIDCSVADQQYIEDCQVCCRPITLQLHIDGDDVTVTAFNEDEGLPY